MSDEPLTLCGKFRTTVTSGSCSSVETFYVAKGSSSSILSWTTSQTLNLIKAVSTVEPPGNLPPDAPDFLKEFPNLTSGMGKYKGEPARIHVDESVKPVAQPHRRVPFHVRKQVEEKLKQLENDDIIHRTKSHVSVFLKRGGNMQLHVSVMFTSYGNVKIKVYVFPSR